MNVVVLVVGLAGGRWTRKSAKESNEAQKEANASQLYSGFSDRQTAELTRLASRLQAVESDREEDRREWEASRLRNREHTKWDWVLVRRLRAALPDEEFPDPPPLDL